MHLGRDGLSTQSAVAGATFMNKFAPYAMQAPPLKRRTHQWFTEFDFSTELLIYVKIFISHFNTFLDNSRYFFFHFLSFESNFHPQALSFPLHKNGLANVPKLVGHASRLTNN